MTIGERIKQARKEKGLTQKRLGELSGTSEITVRQYEIGKRQPRLDQLQRIATALGVPVVDLLGSYEGPPLPELVDGDNLEESPTVEIPAGFQASETLHGKIRARTRINSAVDQMTPEGQSKVADYAEDILPRYRRPASEDSVREATEQFRKAASSGVEVLAEFIRHRRQDAGEPAPASPDKDTPAPEPPPETAENGG